MSLVAYGSSDESENEEETNEQPQVETKVQEKSLTVPVQNINNSTAKLQLPTPKSDERLEINGDSEDVDEPVLDFNVIPRPKPIEVEEINIQETDKLPVPKKIDYANIEQPPKKDRKPARITIPSLSDFKDVEENGSQKDPIKKKPSEKGSGLLGLLPPPRNSVIKTKLNSLVPNVLTKKPVPTKKTAPPAISAKPATSTLKSLSSYNSDSEDEDEKGTGTPSGIDFFSLSTPTKIPDEELLPMSTAEMNAIAGLSEPRKFDHVVENSVEENVESNKTLVSSVMNLPKEDILLKNKAEVGPKLPVPEQEYHVDSDGNIAFDDKAIEYLCGKRGVKRKNEFSNVDIVEINGEDIKPDEREWLVKALTEEPVQRPISSSSGPGGQSKKKHQITYLAHQAKAMEIELKNQWAQNRSNRQQTRSKYGF